MTLPIFMLLGFASWTLILLVFTVGVYRWTRIFRGSALISEFSAEKGEGMDWYHRSMRAHANCLENLPVFAVLVFGIHVTHVATNYAGLVCAIVLAARVAQSLVHICFVQVDRVVYVRFFFFFVQIVGFLALSG